MPDEMRVNDEQLDASDIQQLENADQIAHFFAKLRYNVDIRRPIPLDATPYANKQDLKMQIGRHELIATDTADADIRVYLFEVRSVTAKLRNELARGFLKTSDAKVLLVLTVDYEDIEFVYLERSDPQKTRRKGLSLKVTIRPIPLTVDRRKPDSVALRVLKRFTFTEEDADYQWEKLRSAYILAEWSEEYFNNRALFSDYYLKERLTDPRITPEWDEDVRPIGREMFRHLTSARKNYTRQTEDVIRKGLFERTFKLLGFDFAERKSGSSSAEEADYLLYAPDDGSQREHDQPIAAALTYVWNRNLDDVDESRELEEEKGGTPFEIPGAMVVSLLEAQVAPWVIVTNGKLWRLYSSTASNKATNYYEIDLEEAIAADDQIIALKYWWLMFRREAFTGFLDDLLKNSADYAKELGDRLKDRVFVEIFPQFAKGFIADMRGQGEQEADIDLDAVFDATMTFLYRLMFTLYAESLELVPMSEVNGYRHKSLYRLKREIADVGGTVLDESPDKLSKHYKATSADLYARLSDLFTVIDEGSDDLNMPTYNGGLFSRETDSGRFLRRFRIPDRYLALGLDRLTRDVDTKTQALAYIDFKSLGVRQLGSIYEGLLEFKLKIAAEPLAVTKQKGKEVYQSAKKVKKPLATLAKGDVYLENDKQERKATGSYYTPDYIVKYIVQHTVGPVLDRKFEELIPRLRSAQKGYREYAALVEARRKSFAPSPPSPLSHKGRGGVESVESKSTRLDVPTELKKRMTELARNFRKEPTQSEAILWQAIRNRQLDGRKFRRQQPVGAFVLDFYCADERLAVEVDGRIHESQQEADRLRQELIEELGIRFVRVTAEAVEKNLSSVLQQIRSVFLRSAPSSPGPFSHSGEKGSNPDGEKSPLSPRSSGRGDLGVREESPATYWNNPEMQNLVDDCLNVRVLDPAMGSGHFLVEVVDTISNRLIDFLNGWTENPVWNFIDQTRQDILDDMERQHVSIDPDRLTRVTLLKRAVLKRCIYGVDLNRMAVELAKVSLWLDAFTLGAPLSFLDHHLKHGNSLIGARVADVQDYLKAKHGEMVDMFSGSKFAGVMLATDLMRQVSYLSDNTIEQTRQSKQAYRDASGHLAPYKRVLDVYTSRWFGNATPKKAKTDTVRLFLQDPQAEAWFSDPTAPLNNSLIAADVVAKTALQAAEDKRFFHWELEFPEVFFAPSKPGGQDVQLRQDGGFDAVVGNPPYGRYGLLSDQHKDFIRDRNFAFGSADIAEAFMSVVPEITASSRVGMIVPKVFTYVVNWSSIRDQLRFSGIAFIADVSQAFPDVLYEQVIYGSGNSENVKIGVATGENIVETHEAKLENFKSELYPIYLDRNNESIFDSVQRQSVKLGEVYEYWYGKGGAVPKLTTDPTAYKIVQGRDIARYTEHDNEAIYLPVEAVSANEIQASKKKKIIIQDIVAHVTKPIPRIILMATLDDDKRLPLNTVTCVVETGTPKYSVEYCLAILNSNFCSWYVYHFIYNCAIRTMHFMPGYIDRTPIPRIDFTTPTNERERMTEQITGAYSRGDNAGVLHRVQAALESNQTDVVHDVLAHLAQTMIDLNKSKQAEVGRFLAWLEDTLTPPAPSPTHSAPGEGELGLRDEGQESPLSPRGRGDLGVRGQRGSLIDTFTGKTIIQGYLGDYQKGDGELSWEDFLYRLHQNRKRFAVSLDDVAGEIQIAYEKSLEALIPVKRDLARTDALIDKIVYRLYGLTDAEIELIERPGYEQALTDAKSQVIKDDKIDDEQKIEKIAGGILPAAKRFFERVEPHEVEATLNDELPNWRTLPPDAPTFLLTGDYNLRSLPEHMDFSSAVIPYAKAVEVVLHKQIFEPFRDSHSSADCRNSFLQAFMRGEKDLTLGSYMIILSSSKEAALRRFIARALPNVEGLVTTLNDEAVRDIRNKAAHDEVLTRDEARQARAWALGILGMV